MKTWKQKFLLITVGQTISLVGSSAVQFTLIWWLAQETSSPMVLGFAGLAAYLPVIFLSPIAGIWADRYNRKAICIAADMLTGAAALVYALALLHSPLPPWTAVVVLFIRGAVGTFQQPCIQAIIPQLVPPEYLVKVNGWTQLMQSGSLMLGPVLGAALYAAFTLPVVLITDIVGALFASVSLALVAIPRLKRPETEQGASTGFVRQFQEGIAVYREDRNLLRLLLAQTLCMVFFMPLGSFYPLMTSSYFNLSAWYGSAVEFTFAAGMMVTAFLFGSVITVKNKLSVAYLGLFGLGIATAICGLVPPVFAGWVVFAVACAVMGGFGNVHSIPLLAYMQETIAPEKMGRAFSLMGLMGSLTMPLGLLVAGPVAELIGVHMWFAISGAGILLITLVFWSSSRKQLKKN